MLCLGSVPRAAVPVTAHQLSFVSPAVWLARDSWTPWVSYYPPQALPSLSTVTGGIKGHKRKCHTVGCSLWSQWAPHGEEGGTRTHRSILQACSWSHCLMQTWTFLRTAISRICPGCKQSERSHPQVRPHPATAWSLSFFNALTGTQAHLGVSPALPNTNTAVPSVPEWHMKLKSESSWIISLHSELLLIFSKILHITQTNGNGEWGSDYQGNICSN